MVVNLGMTPPDLANQLNSGAGAGAMKAVDLAFTALGESLRTAASGSTNSTDTMHDFWSGPAHDQAHAAFTKHASWFTEQAAQADIVAAQARSAAAAFTAVQTAVNELAVTYTAAEKLQTATSLLGGALPGASAIAAGASVTMAVTRVFSALAMDGYAASAQGIIKVLTPPTIAPSIVNPLYTTGQQTTLVSDHTPGIGPIGNSGPGTTSGPGGHTTGGTDPGGTDGSQGPGSGNGSTGTTGDPAGQPTTGQDGLNPLSPDQNGADSGVNDAGTTQSLTSTESDLTDPLQTSTTLAGLNGGVGSTVLLSMTRSGLGTVPSTAAGFRMPGSWPTTGKAFGAGTGEPAEEAVAPRRGVTAPTSTMRRRRDEERRPGKVFAPGETEDVPTLEEPPEIGVIGYTADDSSD